MGYRGKVVEREEARRLRALGWTMPDIAAALSVSRSSVSLWARDVAVELGPRRLAPRLPNASERRKAAEIADLLDAGRARIGPLSERDLLIAGTALYAGEGSKTGHEVGFANTNPAMVELFCAWLRRFFEIDESRLRARLYLHQGLDLEEATAFWSRLCAIPLGHFQVPYRAIADPSLRLTKHVRGCVSVRYSCSRTHREVMGLVQALLRSSTIPG
jgi:transcriptional regulator with XRE-family HTH domain